MLSGPGHQVAQNKPPLISSNISSLQHQSLSFQISPSISDLRQMHQHMPQVLYCPNYVTMGNGDLLALFPRASQMQNTTMLSMTKNSFLSSVDWKNGIISWKGLSTRLRFSMTIVISHIFALHRTLTVTTHGGHSTCLALTLS